VPAIVADLIIAAAKNGERDPARLYEQVLKAYGIDDRRCWSTSASQPGLSPWLHSHTWSFNFKTSVNFETFWR
jgi:hypothetical protein